MRKLTRSLVVAIALVTIASVPLAPVTLAPAAAATALPTTVPHEKCPLDVRTCLDQFARMRERPWLGADVDPDSSGAWVVRAIVENGPAKRAGIRAGDRIVAIDGARIGSREGSQSRAGWRVGERAAFTIRRGPHEQHVVMMGERVPDAMFAKIVGEHMVEHHMAAVTGEGSKRR